MADNLPLDYSCPHPPSTIPPPLAYVPGNRCSSFGDGEEQSLRARVSGSLTGTDTATLSARLRRRARTYTSAITVLSAALPGERVLAQLRIVCALTRSEESPRRGGTRRLLTLIARLHGDARVHAVQR